MARKWASIKRRLLAKPSGEQPEQLGEHPRNGKYDHKYDQAKILSLGTSRSSFARISTKNEVAEAPNHDATKSICVEDTAAKSLSNYTAHPRILANATWYQGGLETSSEEMLRLLYLQPGKADDPVEGELVRVSLKDAPRYDALSYSWGTHNQWKEITVDRKPGFTVTLTLWHALRRLRSGTAVRALWIDALCINQDHTAERNSQVLNMGRIFSSARSVVVWLGESGEVSSDQLLLQISTEKEEFMSRLRRATPDVTRAWWNRVWVLQEVAMARELMVYFGPYVLSWSEFLALDDGESDWASVVNLRDIRSSVRLLGTDRPIELLEILSRSGNCYASDPLDYIFGLLGLADKDLLRIHDIAPDYSIALIDLLRRLALYVAITVGLINSAHTRAHTAEWYTRENIDTVKQNHIAGIASDLRIDVTSEEYNLIMLQNWLTQWRHVQLAHLLENSGLLDTIPKGTKHLLLAARHDYDVTIRDLLINNTVLPNDTDVKGRSALHTAVQNRSVRAVEALVTFPSVLVNWKDNFNRTPLSYAVQLGDLETTKLLLDSGKVKDASEQIGAHDFGRLSGPIKYAMEDLLATRGVAVPD